ncbi:MAG TPA: sugar MFS transporter [Candidatus Angelobacter sp.]|nr:sugar MFS transporter [Candidatus Angelobacter sp.]
MTKAESHITSIPQSAEVQLSASAPAKTDIAAMAMVSTLFFAWGFLTVLNDILIPHLKNVFDLNYGEVMLVQFAFFSSYFIFSMPSGKLIEWIGYKRSMVAGLLTMAAGALLFVPAASIPSFPVFLTALIVLAAGMTILQTSANPYVAILGPPQTASSRLNLTQGFNSLGTFLAPRFGAWLILGGTTAVVSAAAMQAMSAGELHAYRVQQAASVKLPYVGLGMALVVLAVIIAGFKLPVIGYAEMHGEVKDSIWAHSRLLLGAVAIFVYVGAEVAIGSLMTNYFNQRETGNLTIPQAAGYLQFYWGGAMVGRFAGALLLRRLRTQKLLAASAAVAATLTAMSILTFGHLAMWSLILVGLFNSIMFPSIFTLAIEGMGPLTGEASGLLVAAIVGGAVIPELQGVLSDHIGIHRAFILPVACYLYIVFYALRGARPDARLPQLQAQ